MSYCNAKIPRGNTKRKNAAAYYIAYKFPAPSPDPPPGPTPPDPPEPPPPGTFTPWLSNPGNSIIAQGYWINRTFTGGYSKIPNRSMWGSYPGQQYALPTGSTLPNCTGWVYGRLMYCMNTTVSTAVPVSGNAGDWYTSTSWPTSQYPSIAAIACWRGGSAGHVAFVEAIGYDSANNWQYIIISEAGYSNGYYGGTWWNYGGVQNTTLYRGSMSRWYGYTFQGFINTPENLIVR